MFSSDVNRHSKRMPAVLVLVIVAILVVADVCGAQTNSLSGPVVGYVFDRQASNVRPIQGILGSATVGAPVETDAAMISQSLALGATHAIVSTDQALLALSLSGGKSSSLAIPSLPPNPTRMAASIQATAAAVYYSSTNEVRIVTGLPQEPRYAGTVHVDRPLTRMAVSDDGRVLVYATDEADGNFLYAWTASSGASRFVTSATSISGIAITRNGDAIVTAEADNEVFAIFDASGGAVRRLLADVRQGVSRPIGVALSPDGRILVGNKESATVTVLDSNGRLLRTLHCDCAVSGVYPIRDAVFLLTDGIDHTLYLLDAGSPEERILFVPPPQE